MPSFKKSLIVEQFQGNYLKLKLHLMGNTETELMKIIIKYKIQRLPLLFLTYPSVDAVTIATFPSSLRLAAAVELILNALKVPKHNFTLELRSVIFQAFFAGFRVGLEIISSSNPPALPLPKLSPRALNDTSLTSLLPHNYHRDAFTRYVRKFLTVFIQ